MNYQWLKEAVITLIRLRWQSFKLSSQRRNSSSLDLIEEARREAAVKGLYRNYYARVER